MGQGGGERKLHLPVSNENAVAGRATIRSGRKHQANLLQFLCRPLHLFCVTGAGNYVSYHSNECRMSIGAACSYQVDSQILGEVFRFDI